MENELKGDLVAEAGTVYEYTKITGYLYASGADTKTAFPKLTSVGGYLDARGADTKTAFPKLTSVGGYLDASGADTKTAFRADIKWNDPNCQAVNRCRSMLLASFAAAGFSFADGVLARIVSQRGPVSRVIICGKKEVSYLVTNGEAYSHGKTLKEARDGLMFKIGKRDPAEFKGWKMDRIVTRGEAIRAYRIITGACEGGVRSWLEQRQTPEKISVQGIIELTKGAFGAEEFKRFFADKKEGVAA